MTFARQMGLFRVVDLSRVGDPEFMRRDFCLNCTLPFDCDESHPGCEFQNSLAERTEVERPSGRVQSDGIILLPLAYRRRQERRRESWARAKQTI